MTEAVAVPARWLDEVRREAWDLFLKTPDPAKTVETWRRVRFGAWRLQELAEGATSDGPSGGAPRSALSPEGGEGDGEGPDGPDDVGALFRQRGNRSRPVIELSSDAARQGVLLLSLEEAAAFHPDKVAPPFAAMSAADDFRKLEAASRARFRGGAFLYIPRGVRVERPIDIVFAEAGREAFAFPRVLVLAEAGSEATIVEEHLHDGGPADDAGASRSSTVAFSRLAAGPGARIRFFYHQGQSAGNSHFWHQTVELGENAELRHYSVFLGAAVHKSQLDVKLAGPGARSELYGILLGTRDQVFDPHTSQDHRAPRTTSDLLYRSALKTRARSIYTGLIRVAKEARGAEAYQQNNNILLSNDARADSTPVLEILTDDVRCKHGATVGPMNPDELFYLQSRGLSPEEAAKMLLLGFFSPVLGRIPLGRLRERAVAEIEERSTP